jgi:hypothetical protein
MKYFFAKKVFLPQFRIIISYKTKLILINYFFTTVQYFIKHLFLTVEAKIYLYIFLSQCGEKKIQFGCFILDTIFIIYP